MIVAVPAATPQMTPDVEPAVATAVLLLVQVPPVEVVERVTQLLTHMLVLPVITEGSGLTVTVAVTKQLPGNV